MDRNSSILGISDAKYISIPYQQKDVLLMPMNKYYDHVHFCLESLFQSQGKVSKIIERQSCPCLTFSVTAPFIFLAILICSLIIFFSRPVYVSDLYVEGFTKTNYSICLDEGTNTKLLILVASAPENFEKRLAVRRTWGSYSRHPNITIAFVLGDFLSKYTKLIDKEEKKYNDIIIGKSLDTYKYLTLKTLAMLKWAQKYCSKATFLMKADDDSFLNVPAWLAITDLDKSMTGNTIWGYTMIPYNVPVRDVESKHYVSHRQYPYYIYPYHVCGEAYMMGFDCVEPLLRQSFKSRYVGVEDAFLTGIVAEDVGIARRKVFAVNGSMLLERAVVHAVKPRQMFVLWYIFKLLNGKLLAVEETQLMKQFVTLKPVWSI